MRSDLTIKTNPQIPICPENLSTEQSSSLQTQIDQINNSSIGNITSAGNQPQEDQTAAQKLTQQTKPSISVYGDGADMKGKLVESLSNAANPSQGVGDQQSVQLLETALKSTPPQSNAQHAEQPDPISQTKICDTATHSTTITKEISSGQHPHLGKEISTEVQKIFNHTTEKAPVDSFIEAIKQEKFLGKEVKGEYPIDFKKLGLSKEDIKEAGIEGKIFKNKDGEFDFKITGKCSPATVKCLRVLKQRLETIRNSNNSNFKTIEINIEPNTAGPLNANDLNVLENHGLIKYKIINDLNNPGESQIMKLILDPGKDEKGDGLTVSIYKGIYDHALTKLSEKIPLKVVFEGGEFKGSPGVKPLRPNWRSDKLFELSSFSREVQGALWEDVDEYLKSKCVEKPKEHIPNNSHSTIAEHKNIDNTFNETIEQNEQKIQINSNKLNIPKSNLNKIKGIKEKLEGLDSKDGESVLTALEDVLDGFDKLLPQESPKKLKSAKQIVAQARKTLKNREDIRKRFLEVAQKLSSELDKLIQGISVQDNDIDLGPIYDLCISREVNIDVAVWDYNSEIEKLLSLSKTDVKRTSEGFELLGKLSILGIQNSQIKAKLEQKGIPSNVGDSDVDRLFNLLKTYNTNETPYGTTQDEYLGAFANWIKTDKSSQALYGTE